MKPLKGLIIFAILAISIASAAHTVFAAGSCSVSSAGVAFLGYNVFGAAADDQSGSVSITCGGNITPATLTVALDKGGNSSGLPNRSMKNGSNTDTLTYNLYFDVARTMIWGDGTAGTVTWKITGNAIKNPVFTQSIFGRITPGQTNASVGSYSDTVTMTLTF